MAALDEITSRLEEFKNSGLIEHYEILVVDDSVRVQVRAPASQDVATVKEFLGEAFSTLLSPSQLNVESAPA
jgi:hypothetical protein